MDSGLNIKDIVNQMNVEYNLIEKQLDKISKSIFTIHKDTDLINHEIMELSTELENLGISLNELNERVTLWDVWLTKSQTARSLTSIASTYWKCTTMVE